MIIDKSNLNLIGSKETSIHDLVLEKTDFDLINKKIKLFVNNMIEIVLYNVVDMLFLNKSEFGSWRTGELWDWEEIPNSVTKDNYLFEKENSLKECGVWNENMFAVRFLFSDLSEFKLICEKIEFNKIWESKK